MSLVFGKPQIVVDGIVVLNEKKSEAEVVRQKRIADEVKREEAKKKSKG